ncbi:hypothetical protein LOTGIDRAFT_171757 [Lottia gigantea]|uniref:JmjC domain-containing protein n=1 Tax=Lottia gigantea TaxID=225164 RepID=V4CLH4_LOTGI|nr:hypothetical protein LOTGIDRAFT_171757 [Lottia gigantea]ESP03150.1 hypothetical protein LOTGIDRAFT_171757 [Lottia gigantea]
MWKIFSFHWIYFLFSLFCLLHSVTCVKKVSKTPRKSKESEVSKESTKRSASLDDDPSLWPGHLQPLGSSQQVHKVDAYKKYLKPEEFLNSYAAPYLPVLFQAVEQTSIAYEKWGNITYFTVLPQTLTNWVHISPEVGQVSFRKFLLNYTDKGSVFNNKVPFFMRSAKWEPYRDDVSVPKCLHCEPILNSFSTHKLWISHTDQSSPIHRRNKDTIHCTFVGSQEFTLISHIEYGDKVPVDYTTIDINKVDFTKFPTLREVEYHKVRVKAGDCLYIPTKWYWQVRSTGKTYSADIEWYHRNKTVKSSNCKTKTSISSLNSVVFKDIDDPTTIETDVLLHYFTTYLLNVPKFTLPQFERHLKKDKKFMEDLIEWTDELQHITKEVFETLDVNKDSRFSMADLESLSQPMLEDIRGLFLDRLQDYDDILKDQQEEAKESKKQSEKENKAKDAPATTGPVDDYLKNYIGQLEDVLKESIEEMSVTGHLPDIKKKFAEKQAQGKTGNADKPKQSTKPKTEREKAKEKLEQDRQRRKEKQEAENIKEKTKDDEKYLIVDDSVEEEIMADDDDDSTTGSTNKRTPTADKADTKDNKSHTKDNKADTRHVDKKTGRKGQDGKEAKQKNTGSKIKTEL